MNRSINAGNAAVTIGIKNRIKRGLTGVERDLKAGGRRLSGIGATLVAASGGLLAFPIKAASEMQETMGKFNVVFGDSAKSVEEWSDKTANAMGVPEQQMASMLSSMQDLLVPMGVLPESATDMSKELSKLSVDLGSFNNMDSDQVFQDMMAAMTGSGEVMKKYGVILNETAVKQELMAMGMDPKNADNAAKAQARLNIVMKGTTAAQGDAIRTQGSFTNQMKSLWATTKDVSASLGGPLLDDLAGIVKLVGVAASGVKDFVEENQGLVRVIGLGVLAVGGIGAALVGAGTALSVAGIAVGALGSAVAFLVSPIGLGIVAIGGLGYAFLKYTQMGADAIQWLQNRFGPMVETVENAVSAIMAAVQEGDFSKAWDLTTATMEMLWLDMTEELRTTWAAVVDYVLNAGSGMAEGIGQLIQGIASMLDGLMDKYKSVYDSIYNKSADLFDAAGAKITGVKTIGGPVKRESAFDRQFGGQDSSIRSAIDSVRKFGVAMEQEAAGQKSERAANREAERKERQERLSALRKSLNTQGEAAKAAKAEAKNNKEDQPQQPPQNRPEDLKSALEQLRKESQQNSPELGQIAEQAEQSQRSGPSGTFSAFAASVIGASSPQGRIEKLTEKIASSSEASAKKLGILAAMKDAAKVAGVEIAEGDTADTLGQKIAAAMGQKDPFVSSYVPKLDTKSKVDQSNAPGALGGDRRILATLDTIAAGTTETAKNTGKPQAAVLG